MDTGTYTKRIPASEFETELFRGYIKAELSRWPSEVFAVSVDSKDHEDGTFGIAIDNARRPFNAMTIISDYANDALTGRAWIESDNGRIVVMIEVTDAQGRTQTHSASMLPSATWAQDASW